MKQDLPSESDSLLLAYRQMVLARAVDNKNITLYKQNKSHFQIGCAGHEAVQLAMANTLRPKHDWAYPYYRDLAFCIGFGVTPKEIFLNTLNKADDPSSGGRQMPMHYGNKPLNIVSQSSPTGTQFLQAVGTAAALKRRGGDAVVYVSAGEGTTAQGSYHEALNWAARERLPMIFLIQDNKFAISVHISQQIAGGSVAQISSGYEGLDVLEINGLDYTESHSSLLKATEQARNGEGPSVVVAEVVRLQSHSISDNQEKYRNTQELEAEREKDPLPQLESLLIAKGIVTEEKAHSIRTQLQAQVDADAAWAEEQPDPSPETFQDHVYSAPSTEKDSEENLEENEKEEVFLVDALNAALDEELTRAPDTILYGQDVADGKGGVFSVTAGLTKKHGIKRVFNSPLAEASIVGSALGMSLTGIRPIVEVQFGDYIWTAMMQIRNELSMMRYRSNGIFHCPVVIRAAVGGYIHGSLYHSQNIEATFSHFPGLVIILPSNATDAKGLLKSAIRCEDPVLFLEHKGLYRQVFAKGKKGGSEDLIPIGHARVAREGSDATIVTWGALVHRSLFVAERIAQEGIKIEVIDLRTILPLDIQTILKSVQKTGRLLIAHEDALFMGFGAEIAATVSDQAFEYLDAPIRRVGGAFTPVPHAPVLEEQVLPQERDIEAALRGLIDY